jgi:hypothetical protein
MCEANNIDISEEILHIPFITLVIRLRNDGVVRKKNQMNSPMN